MRAKAGRGYSPRSEKGTDLWWLYWTTIIVIVIGSLLLFLSMRGPTGAKLALGFIAGGYVLLCGIVIRLAYWLIAKVSLRPLRVALQVLIPVLILMGREGWLGDGMTFDLNLNGSRESSSHTSSRNVKPTETDLSGKTSGCVVADAEGNVARGFLAHATKAGCSPNDGVAVQVRVELDAKDVFCFVPLFKTATWTYRVRIVLEPPRTKAEQSLREFLQSGLDEEELAERTDLRSTAELTGNVRRTSYGLESCRQFNEELGRSAAKQALIEYQRLLAEQQKQSAEQRHEQLAAEKKKAQGEQARRKTRQGTGRR